MKAELEKNAEALKKILNAKSLAVVGASNSFMSPATNLMATILSSGYKGKVYPIHPKEDTALGLKVYRSVTDIPGDVELVIIVVSNRIVPQVLKECGEKGIKSAVVITAGYREMGKEGEKLERELLKTARELGIRFTGPNCIGIINTHNDLDCSMFYYEGVPGGVGLVSQSGSYITQPLPYFYRRGINLSSAISVGNQTDIDIADCLAFFADDDNTRAVAAYIEGIADGEKFIEAARLATAKKPVIALYVGGTEAGSRAGKSHTGAITSPDLIIDAVFAQTGIIRARDVQDLFDFVHAFSLQPLPKGNRTAVITNSGGPGVSMVDSAVRQGLSVPEFSKGFQKELREISIHTAQVGNPVDMTMDFDVKKQFIDVTKMVIESGEVDAILFYGVFGGANFNKKFDILGITQKEMRTGYYKYMDQVIGDFNELIKASEIPVVTASFTGREEPAVAKMIEMGIPIYTTPERASAALAAMAKYAKFRGIF